MFLLESVLAATLRVQRYAGLLATLSPPVQNACPEAPVCAGTGSPEACCLLAAAAAPSPWVKAGVGVSSVSRGERPCWEETQGCCHQCPSTLSGGSPLAPRFL